MGTYLGKLWHSLLPSLHGNSRFNLENLGRQSRNPPHMFYSLNASQFFGGYLVDLKALIPTLWIWK